MTQQNELDELFDSLRHVTLDEETKRTHRSVISVSPAQTARPQRRIKLAPLIASVAFVFLAFFFLSSLLSNPDLNETSAFSDIEPYRTVIAPTSSDTTFHATLPTRPNTKEILMSDRKWKNELSTLLTQLEPVEWGDAVETPVFDLGIYEEDSSLVRFKVYDGTSAWVFKDLDSGETYSTSHGSLTNVVNMMSNTYYR